MRFVVGSEDRNACNFSPAASEEAITVGASTLGDERAYFSNHGPCVDVFAPGLDIVSTYTGNEHATTTLSGTSMASAHVAGLLAYFLSIYPSKQFDPVFDDADNLVSIVSQRVLSSPSSKSTSPSSLYAMAHRALPPFIASYLPRLDLVLQHTQDDVAPVPKVKPLTPIQLKRAVLALSSKDLLQKLPDKTVNLLVFNNASTYH